MFYPEKSLFCSPPKASAYFWSPPGPLFPTLRYPLKHQSQGSSTLGHPVVAGSMQPPQHPPVPKLQSGWEGPGPGGGLWHHPLCSPFPTSAWKNNELAAKRMFENEVAWANSSHRSYVMCASSRGNLPGFAKAVREGTGLKLRYLYSPAHRSSAESSPSLGGFSWQTLYGK